MMRQRPAPSPWATLLCALPTPKLASPRRLSPFPFPPRPSASPSITLRLRAPTAATTSCATGLAPMRSARGGEPRRTFSRLFSARPTSSGPSRPSSPHRALDAPSTRASARKDFLPARFCGRPQLALHTRRPVDESDSREGLSPVSSPHAAALATARRTARPSHCSPSPSPSIFPPTRNPLRGTSCEGATRTSRPARCAGSWSTSSAVVGARGSPRSLSLMVPLLSKTHSCQ